MQQSVFTFRFHPRTSPVFAWEIPRALSSEDLQFDIYHIYQETSAFLLLIRLFGGGFPDIFFHQYGFLSASSVCPQTGLYHLSSVAETGVGIRRSLQHTHPHAITSPAVCVPQVISPSPIRGMRSPMDSRAPARQRRESR